MSARRRPVRLAGSPLSGRVYALTRYAREGDGVIRAVVEGGKHDVTGDFEALLLRRLMDPDSPDVVAILDGAADGEELDREQRGQLRAFERRLRAVVERHNDRLEERG